MAMFNIFNKKGEEIKSEKEVKIEQKKEKKEKLIEKEIAVKESPKIGKEQKRTGQSFGSLNSVHVTEKATDLTEFNQYIFNVPLKANKIEIKKAVEDLYNVKVKGVNTIHSPSKNRRLGRSEGKRGGLEKGTKKAIVVLKDGYKIEVLPR